MFHFPIFCREIELSAAKFICKHRFLPLENVTFKVKFSYC